MPPKMPSAAPTIAGAAEASDETTPVIWSLKPEKSKDTQSPPPRPYPAHPPGASPTAKHAHHNPQPKHPKQPRHQSRSDLASHPSPRYPSPRTDQTPTASPLRTGPHPPPGKQAPDTAPPRTKAGPPLMRLPQKRHKEQTRTDQQYDHQHRPDRPKVAIDGRQDKRLLVRVRAHPRPPHGHAP